MRATSDGRGDVCAPGPLAPGPALAFGATPLEFLRHVGVRGTAPAAARTGGTTWTDGRRGLMGDAGPRGTMTQVLAGVALAFRQRGEDRVALVFEEPAAVESGAWHEGLNLAGVLKAPMILALAAPRPSATRVAPPLDVEALGASYGVAVARLGAESYRVLFEAFRTARERASRGDGPVLVQLDPVARSETWAAHDAFLESADVRARLSEADVAALERAAAAGVEHAASRLGREPGPGPESALAEVWTGRRAAEPWTRADDPSPDRPSWVGLEDEELERAHVP